MGVYFQALAFGSSKLRFVKSEQVVKLRALLTTAAATTTAATTTTTGSM